MKQITIIGAGIGGLTAAIALQQRGFEVEIFESTPEFGKAGSGINLAINAMQVFKRLGLYDTILEHAHITHSMNIRTKNLGYLAVAPLSKFETEFEVKSVAIHRATLHKILIQQIGNTGNTKIHLNKKLRSLKQDKETIDLLFEDGTVHTSQIVIGADGIHSVVRASIFNDSELRDAGQICWRGISSASISPEHRGELNEIWGKGKRFGFVHIKENEIYWFAVMNKNTLMKQDLDLKDLFSDYHPTVMTIIGGTQKENVLRNEIWDLKPIATWYHGNVCLLGDACHATTPNMGQGAVQAVESAMALSICLSEESKIEEAFKRYQKIRKKKANHITDTSWRIGKLAQVNNPIGALLRDMLLKITPRAVMEKQNRRVFELNY